MWSLSGYVLRRHLAPFGFALAGLTSLMLINQIAKQLPSLLGKGLPTSEIVGVFVLSVPFIVAVTLPMAVLMAVLRVFTRLASDDEITAMTMGGFRILRLITPVLAGAACVGALSLFWNDQIVPRSNHELRTLQARIYSTTPPFTSVDTYQSDREMTISELRGAVRSARAAAERARLEGRQAIERAARQRAATYEVEIQKKYAIAAACLIFALLGAPIGLRFQRGGVGLVIAVSVAVFTVYYVGLIGGEELGDRLIVSPFFAMWSPNLVLVIVGLGALWLARKPVYAPVAKSSATYRAPLPRTVKIAAWTLAGHGAAILVYGVLLQRFLTSGRPDLSGAVERFLTMGVIAWGLLNRAPWAWWAGVLTAGLLLAASLLALGAAAALGEGARVMLAPGDAPFLILSSLALAIVVALLLAPSCRTAFRDPAA